MNITTVDLSVLPPANVNGAAHRDALNDVSVAHEFDRLFAGMLVKSMNLSSGASIDATASNDNVAQALLGNVFVELLADNSLGVGQQLLRQTLNGVGGYK